MSSITDKLDPGHDEGSLLGCSLGPVDEVGHAASMRVRGTLCAVTAPEHARLLDELVEQGYVELRVGLDGLLLCTSHGLDLWDDLQHRLDPVGGHVTLVGATGVVRRVLEVITSSPVHFCPTVVPTAA